MAYSQAWLDSTSAIRMVLLEVEVFDVVLDANTTKYFSSAPYITTDGSVVFNPILNGDVSMNETLSEDGGVAMSFADIELINANGELDIWLDASKFIWSNKSIKVYFGDPKWTCTDIAQVRTDFLKVFDGVVKDIDSRDRHTINLKVRDKLERLNAPITENKIGTYGTWSSGQQNSDNIKPLIFGEVHNIEPVLIDPSRLEYMFNDGVCEGMIEIRDNGVPIWTRDGIITGATVSDTLGTFKLTYPSVGTITASVQGVNKSINLSNGNLVNSSYLNNLVNLIALITTQYGKASTRFTASDLDLVNLAAQSTAIAATCAAGVNISDRTNVLNVCKELANSVGAQVFVTRQGLLQILQYGVGSNSATDPITLTTVTDSEVVKGTFNIAKRLDVVASIKLGYCKNWTVQSELLTSIPQEDKDAFATEWYSVTNTNQDIKALYKLDEDPVQKDTLLINKAQAETEAQRLVSFFSNQHTVYKFTGTSTCLALKLGQSLTVIHNRFDLYNSGNGRLGQVVGLFPNWTTGNVEVEVLI